MSIISILTRQAPRFVSPDGNSTIVFDAVFEDGFSASVEYTKFPIEVGAMATDHGIIKPAQWYLRGGVSNNPLQPTIKDFAGGFLTNFFDSGTIAAIGGISAGFLAGTDQTRSGATLSFLIGLMVARTPFDIETNDFSLSNVVITDIRRVRTPENEGGLEFEAALIELPTIETAISSNKPKAENLPEGDPAKTQAAPTRDKGELFGQPVPKHVKQGIERAFGVPTSNKG